MPFALIYLAASRDAGHGHVVLAGTAGVELGGPLSPEAISLDTDTVWPITEVLSTRVPRLVGDLSDLEGVSPAGFSAQPVRQAIVLPITSIGRASRAGVLIVGLNPLRGFDDNYQGFHPGRRPDLRQLSPTPMPLKRRTGGQKPLMMLLTGLAVEVGLCATLATSKQALSASWRACPMGSPPSIATGISYT